MSKLRCALCGTEPNDKEGGTGLAYLEETLIFNMNRKHPHIVECCACCSNWASNDKDLRTKIRTLFESIKHGDQKHQDWLKEAIDKHFETGPHPAEKK